MRDGGVDLMAGMLRWTPEQLADHLRQRAAPGRPQSQSRGRNAPQVRPIPPNPSPKAPKARKYRNEPVELNGERFDSKAEAARWAQLRLLERAGEIRELRRQVRYELVPSQRTAAGKHVAPVAYVADMVYLDGQGRQVVEDVKGFRTADYKLKVKLMLHVHGIEIREVAA